MNLSHILVFPFSFFLVFSISAQDEHVDLSQIPPLPPEKEGDLICQCISTFLLKKNEIFYFKIDDSFHKVRLMSEGMSMPFPVRNSTTFILYKHVPNGEEGSPQYLPVVEQPLKGGGKKFLIVLSRKNETSAMKSKSINISKAQRPANKIYVLNESSVPIGLQVDETKAVIKANKQYQYEFPNASRNAYTSANIIVRYKGEMRVMASKRLRLIPKRRIFLICFLSKARANLGATPLRMVSYQDMP